MYYQTVSMVETRNKRALNQRAWIDHITFSTNSAHFSSMQFAILHGMTRKTTLYMRSSSLICARKVVTVANVAIDLLLVLCMFGLI